jgi:hypothetical protein
MEASVSLGSQGAACERGPNVGAVDRTLLVVLTVSLLANIGLTLLWREARSAPAASPSVENALPSKGAKLRDLPLVALNGQNLDLNPAASSLPVIVYVFSPTCHWCELNRPIADSLAAQVKGKYRFIGVSTTADGLASYVAKKGPQFPVFYVDPHSPHTDFPLLVTPQTLVFSSDGTFLRGWNGAYLQGTREPVSAFFGATLSELKVPRT